MCTRVLRFHMVAVPASNFPSAAFPSKRYIPPSSMKRSGPRGSRPIIGVDPAFDSSAAPPGQLVAYYRFDGPYVGALGRD
jgi:hypothetical protein